MKHEPNHSNETLHKAMRQVPVPQGLERRIRENWRQQLQTAPRHPAPRYWRWSAATLSTALTCLLVLAGIFHTPSVVDAAYQDIAKDRQLKVGLMLSEQSWQQTHKIQSPPLNMPLEMSKHCNLGEQQTIHLTVAGERRGRVHFFVNQQAFDRFFWQSSAGQYREMPWQVIQPRKNLWVLVLHTPDMNPEKVAQLVNHMFFS